MKKLFRPFSITWGKMPTAKPQTRIAIPTKTETKVFCFCKFSVRNFAKYYCQLTTGRYLPLACKANTNAYRITEQLKMEGVSEDHLDHHTLLRAGLTTAD